MSDSDNPLDRLTRPGGRSLSDDESIPVLTERLTLPSLDLDITLPQPPPPLAAPPPPLPPPPAPPPPPPVVAPRAMPTPPSAARQAASPPVRTAAAAIPSYTSTAAAVTAVEVDWARLEQSLRDAVYRELQPALADEAGRLLRERLQPAVDRVLTTITAELRQSFEARLREVIARTVAAELARLRERG
jgi:hypothetical protein